MKAQMEVLGEKPVTVSEVADILAAKEKLYGKNDTELLYEQKRALEHARIFTKLEAKQAKELTDKVVDLGYTPERAAKIVDLMPETVDDVRAITAKDRFKYTEEDIKSVIDLVDQYR